MRLADAVQPARQARLGRRTPRHGRCRQWCGVCSEEDCDDPDRARARRWTCAIRPAVDAWIGEQTAASGLPGGRQGRRHPSPTTRYPADFIQDNLLIQTHIIQAASPTGVEKLLFLGSSCIYPKLAPQPITEDALLTGPLEPTNEWYAIAKIAGIKLCQAYRRQYGRDFISAMPTNLYGPGDNFDLLSSHVLPALIRKMR